jgi:hypothetical protein
VVYIDESKGLPWIALTSSTPPAILPKMPEEITNLWLIGQGENKNQFVVWHGGMKEIWQGARVQCAPEIPKINGPGSID